MSGKPPSGLVVNGIDFDRWAVVLCKPDAVHRGLVEVILDRIAAAGFIVTSRLDVSAAAWQAHVVYRSLLVDSDQPRGMPGYLKAAFEDRPVAVALAHGAPGIHQRLRQLLGHTDPTRAAAGTIRGDLGDDSLTAALTQKRLVRNLVHTSDDADAARRDFGTWFGPDRHRARKPDFARCAVILCKPDAVERQLAGTVLDRISAAGFTVTDRLDLTAQAWQAHVHYWDLLVDADWYPDRDIPSCLDAMYADKPVAVALAHGEPGFHGRLRQLLGHYDPTRAAADTIRGDLGDDSLTAALTQKRLVRNLVHTSDDADAARRDFGTWFGADRRAFLLPRPPAPTLH
ncbi:nucleoside-diphosphate kinase [Streptomyces sp. NPDC056132]|uniref:nucleoside-diphosphate kinase n=1 Tax=Streptomyces sp. NPDC056132 TaxID=3345722 RepID=UPI0035DE9F97